jgi:hypothetical protein
MYHFSWLQVPIFMIASVLFHGDMLSQNLQPTSQKGITPFAQSITSWLLTKGIKFQGYKLSFSW